MSVLELAPRALLIGLLSALAWTSCAPDDDARRADRPPRDGLSLTVPAERWAASKYCGNVAPEVPVDPTPPYRFARDFLNAKLAGDGLTGWVHGAVPAYQQYVFTYRKEDPTDFMAFFKAEQFSLVPADQTVAATLAGLKRHDKIRVHGEVFENQSPLTHLRITGIEILERFAKPTTNEYAFDLARLEGRTSFEVFGIVHAVVAAETRGHAVVVEHKDLLLPLAVPARHAATAGGLYRGDIVNVAARVVERPHGPPHFEVDGDVEAGIQVVDPMLNCHGKETVVEGYLAKFEQSPAIRTDIYAVRVVDGNGIGRNFTLFPDFAMDDPRFVEVFGAFSAKAKAAWDEAAEAPAVVRNFWKKESLKVRVAGRLNVVSSEQANAQVYIKSADDLTVRPAP